MSNTKPYAIILPGILGLEFGFWSLIVAEIYPD
jgi:hypothetical protein